LIEWFQLKSPVQNSTKIRTVGADFFHSEGRTDRHDKVIAAFALLFRTRLTMMMKFQFSKSK